MLAFLLLLMFHILLDVAEGFPHLLLRHHVADVPVMQALALLLEGRRQGYEGRQLMLLLLLALRRVVVVLPVRELHEDLDGEGLDELEHDADREDVEDEEDAPRPAVRGRLVDGLRKLRHVLAEEGHHPDAESREEVVKVQHEVLALGVLRLFQVRVGHVQQPAPELHAERGEEEDDHAQRHHDVLGGQHQLQDRVHHELHHLELLQLLDHAQQPQQPQDVHVPLQAAAAHGRLVLGHGLRQRGQQERPGREEVELVGPEAPVLGPGVDAQTEADLHHVDQREDQLQVADEDWRVHVVQVVRGLGDDQQQVDQQHEVHARVEGPSLNLLHEPLHAPAVPCLRVPLLNPGVLLRRPQLVLHHATDLAELRLADGPVLGRVDA
mmetsp:Transcript_4822/g.12409  ORF Transcript_4822/g.12409 Transcript_4822/m.12409 type:complete len:381 (+) Transcript_4822:133-1275(+)